MRLSSVLPLRLLACSLGVVAACGGGDDGPAPDAPVGPRCDPTAPFAPPAPVPELNSAGDDMSARLSADELTVVLSRATTLGQDLYIATRASTSEPFSAPALLATVNSIATDESPSLSPDGLVLALESTRNTGTYRVFTSRRASVDATFPAPAPVTGIADGDRQPLLASDSALYLRSATRPGLGQGDLWRAGIDAAGATTEPAALIGGVNSASDESWPVVTADERVMFFGRTDGMVGAELDVYMAARSTAQDGFGAAAQVTGLAQPGVQEVPTWVSPDGCTLYLQSDFSGGQGGIDLYVATRGQ